MNWMNSEEGLAQLAQWVVEHPLRDIKGDLAVFERLNQLTTERVDHRTKKLGEMATTLVEMEKGIQTQINGANWVEGFRKDLAVFQVGTAIEISTDCHTTTETRRSHCTTNDICGKSNGKFREEVHHLDGRGTN